jgi:hypothetical protein
VGNREDHLRPYSGRASPNGNRSAAFGVMQNIF